MPPWRSPMMFSSTLTNSPKSVTFFTVALTTVPGIGKRVAERLVVELRDKVTAGPVGAAVPGAPVAASVGAQVVEALVGLGFTEGAAEKAVAAVLADHPGADSATLLRAALTSLGPRR